MSTSVNVASLEMGYETELEIRNLSHSQRALQRLKKDYLALAALATILFLVLMAVFAPVISEVIGIDAFAENLQKTFASPDSQNYLGTDDKGRDHFARLLYGAQISLSVAFLAGVLALTIGVSTGIVTGYYGGFVDDVMTWFVTTLNSVPQLFLLLIIASLLSPGPVLFIGILGFLGWTGTMRLVRGETLTLREREYVVAAKAMGASDFRIMLQHIFPNLISVVVIQTMLGIGNLIIVESALSFLGFGIPSYIPTWGNMLAESQQFFRRAPHLVIAPGILISITVLCLYVIGDGLRDALDPTTRD